MKLTEIKSPKDIRSFSIAELNDLAKEMRTALLKKLSVHGGHVGPNLGFLEAAIAIHYVFNTPEDKLVFDVSHQCYAHKMLTGRMDAFTDPMEYDSVSGFTNPNESEYDLFTVGHTSTGVSLAGGLAKARDLRGGHENVIAVVGDGSLSGGEAFEGLDFGATLGSNLIIVVNDNDMSIAENHGGLYENLRELRSTNGAAECNYFKALGYDYKYVAYGNDLKSLIEAFKGVKDIDHPVVVHIATQKGEGYLPAEADKEEFHFSAPFDIPTGEPLSISESQSYTDIFADFMLEKMKNNNRVCTITAGTPGSIGFSPERRKRAGKQFIDVGIAEQEAVALSSGIAKGGGRPVFGVVSSFLQRAYDQLSQDVSINSSAAVVNIFYGSALAMNDVTHLGWFDIALVSNIPGWIFFAPTCKEEYLSMLDWSIKQTEHPVAIKVPGKVISDSSRNFPTDYGELLYKYETVVSGDGDAVVIGAGSMLQTGQEVVNILAKNDINATLINPRNLAAIDKDMLRDLSNKGAKIVITIEDGCLWGGFGEKIARFFAETAETKVRCYGLPKEFKDRYDRGALLKECRLTPELIAEDILTAINK